jgi:aminopeptidase-like protein
LLGEQEGKWGTREFSPLNGSDERQLSSPGVRIPTIQIARTVYGTYDEYHTSADNLEFMNIETVCDSAAQIFDLLTDFEFSSKPLQSNIGGGEPQLGKRDLYPTTSTPKLHYGGGREGLSFENVPLDDILMTYQLIDGRTALDIAKASGIGLGAVIKAAQLLKAKGIVN